MRVAPPLVDGLLGPAKMGQSGLCGGALQACAGRHGPCFAGGEGGWTGAVGAGALLCGNCWAGLSCCGRCVGFVGVV